MVVGGVTVAAVGVWLSVKTFSRRRASIVARRVFPVWAAQGPFATGLESATAMRYAWQAVSGGRQKVDRMAKQFSKHAASYDADPAAWEETRSVSLRVANSELSSYVAEAKRLRAVDAWMKESLDFDNFEAVGTLGLTIPFTPADVDAAYATKARQTNPGTRAAEQLHDAYRRAHRLAELSEAAGVDRLKGLIDWRARHNG